jgi:hypothetical protein
MIEVKGGFEKVKCYFLNGVKKMIPRKSIDLQQSKFKKIVDERKLSVDKGSNKSGGTEGTEKKDYVKLILQRRESIQYNDDKNKLIPTDNKLSKYAERKKSLSINSDAFNILKKFKDYPTNTDNDSKSDNRSDNRSDNSKGETLSESKSIDESKKNVEKNDSTKDNE